MKGYDFLFHDILKAIISDTGLKPSAFAASLQRERTLIYKWLSGKYLPKASYIPSLVEFIISSTTESEKIILINHLTEYVKQSNLPQSLNEALLGKTANCSLFLNEILALSINKAWHKPNMSEALETSRENLLSRYLAKLGKHISIHIWAIISAVIGGVFWNLLNHIFSWTYYMGSQGNEPYSLSAFIWGAVTLSPIIILVLLILRKGKQSKVIIPCILYTLIGGLAALIFYTSGIRAGIESLGLSYSFQEILIVLIYASIISAPPYITILVFFKFSPPWHHKILYFVSPICTALIAVILTLSINRPVQEITQLRGLLVGLTIRVSMFYTLILLFKMSRPIEPNASKMEILKFGT